MGEIMRHKWSARGKTMIKRSFRDLFLDWIISYHYLRSTESIENCEHPQATETMSQEKKKTTHALNVIDSKLMMSFNFY